jgi:hypothetical protein
MVSLLQRLSLKVSTNAQEKYRIIAAGPYGSTLQSEGNTHRSMQSGRLRD